MDTSYRDSNRVHFFRTVTPRYRQASTHSDINPAKYGDNIPFDRRSRQYHRSFNPIADLDKLKLKKPRLGPDTPPLESIGKRTSFFVNKNNFDLAVNEIGQRMGGIKQKIYYDDSGNPVLKQNVRQWRFGLDTDKPQIIQEKMQRRQQKHSYEINNRHHENISQQQKEELKRVQSKQENETQKQNEQNYIYSNNIKNKTELGLENWKNNVKLIGQKELEIITEIKGKSDEQFKQDKLRRENVVEEIERKIKQQQEKIRSKEDDQQKEKQINIERKLEKNHQRAKENQQKEKAQHPSKAFTSIQSQYTTQITELYEEDKKKKAYREMLRQRLAKLSPEEQREFFKMRQQKKKAQSTNNDA